MKFPFIYQFGYVGGVLVRDCFWPSQVNGDMWDLWNNNADGAEGTIILYNNNYKTSHANIIEMNWAQWHT